ncbi:hypothetical protein [Rahnella sikkimica]|uniref:Uncharacterized protein n=1 Tax=Rahnella sikkimica TaxID=1805933 RepID=A0A2L1ULC9_9GAMM|nr:hypothetical protein [Rahnella sikkimica]AVF33737.1 hypothetical protein BV494_01815 [Rahnella sikkimica]
MPASLVIASVTTLSYAGILAGRAPDLRRFIAQLNTLSVAPGLMTAMMLCVTACAKAVLRYKSDNKNEGKDSSSWLVNIYR